ncbi:MAG: hypothetical protein GY787_21520 [Alteromonadales bacterium]|nr:hypothetical protein [Alteromonadales bacterium]
MQIGKIEKGCKAIKSLPTLDNYFLDEFLKQTDPQTREDVKQAIKEVIEKRRQTLESELRKLLD